MRFARALALAAVFAAPTLVLGDGLSAVRSAEAAVSIRLSLTELVDRSRYVVIATPAEHRSAWEELASGRRIVTYTRLIVERPLKGEPTGELWVRTLGGRVDSIGQLVSGEARLTEGQRALVFLADVPGTIVVTGLAQGHFPIATDETGVARLRLSPDRPGIVERRGPTIGADEALFGTTLESAMALVIAERARHDAR
jgi:hypothetical protein